jgi:hypothetical protein
MTDTPKYLTAADVLAAEDIQVVDVPVPEWGGVVRLRALSGHEAIRFANLVRDDASPASSAVRIVALCAVDAEGKSLFTDEQVEALKAKSLKAINRLQTVALKLNGLDEEEGKAAKKD